MKMQYRLFIPLLLTAGCFAHKEAPDRLVSARGIEEAEAAAAEVESVDLSGPGAAALPASLPAMPKLKVLYLRDGAFTNFSALAGCAALETLDLGNVRLGALPGEVLSLPALRDLYLSGCGLAAFPEGLEGLPHLRYLNLDRNRISKLPDTLPPHLRWLRLNANQIAELPDGIGGIAGLERLYLRGNRLSALPAGLARCSAITDVDLAQNGLSEFPAVLAELPVLRNLDLSGNTGITALPGDEVLGKMGALRTLRLTGCPLSDDERARVRAALHPQCAIIF